MRTYSYHILGYDVMATMTAQHNNDTQPIVYSGANAEIVRLQLAESFGAFGHRFNPDASTPTDLDAALFATFEGLVQRLGETPSYDPGIPEGAVT